MGLNKQDMNIRVFPGLRAAVNAYQDEVVEK